MKTQKTFLRYFIEFIVILSGVSASFWVEEYRESLQNEEEMYKVIELWLSTDFESGRHQRRIEKLDES